jgi:hypothetical protein
MRAENMRADSRQAATGNWGLRSIECEFDHSFLVEPCLTIGRVFRGSQNTLERLARWRAPGQSFGLRAERFRADSRQAATGNWGLRSIGCEFDHLFLVVPRLTIGHAFRGSQNALKRLMRWRAPGQSFDMRRRKYESRLTSGCYGKLESA